ncbi:hypothetical protein [Leptolyngbya iicbica]|uniref:Uncharacterized protein n=1 Tax=Leptolyngbya iicbica LK TaxID=2294035 RepID=A0A4Q7ECB4_9CYAN|nr:hypothetical protein [Leptolyngbya sp. LK]RZM78875.1 hypothetical protein DYY88_08795 [Leptolyngbya sp. LK]
MTNKLSPINRDDGPALAHFGDGTLFLYDHPFVLSGLDKYRARPDGELTHQEVVLSQQNVLDSKASTHIPDVK